MSSSSHVDSTVFSDFLSFSSSIVLYSWLVLLTVSSVHK